MVPFRSTSATASSTSLMMLQYFSNAFSISKSGVRSIMQPTLAGLPPWMTLVPCMHTRMVVPSGLYTRKPSGPADPLFFPWQSVTRPRSPGWTRDQKVRPVNCPGSARPRISHRRASTWTKRPLWIMYRPTGVLSLNVRPAPSTRAGAGVSMPPLSMFLLPCASFIANNFRFKNRCCFRHY